MQVGSTQVVVAAFARRVMVIVTMMMNMAVTMMVAVVLMSMMRVIIFQQPGAHQIDNQPHDGHRNRLIEIDMNRLGEPYKAFPANQQSDQGQQHCTGKTSQITQLAGAEGETRIARMLSFSEDDCTNY